jgi:hypothetical protein
MYELCPLKLPSITILKILHGEQHFVLTLELCISYYNYSERRQLRDSKDSSKNLYIAHNTELYTPE